MIDIKEEHLESLIDKAIKLNEQDQIVSITKTVDNINPLHFFEAAKVTGENRIFWMNQAEEFYIVGVGKAHELLANENRFDSMKEQWKAVLNNAVVHNPHHVEGTGIIALGGFSFDPKKEKTSLWEKYAHSQFTIPEFILTKYKEETYLTINKKVCQNDDPTILSSKLLQKEKHLLERVNSIPNGNKIIHKKEIAVEQWLETVQKARGVIREDEAKKIVLAREMRVKFSENAEISGVLEKLIKNQSNCYVFAFEQEEDCFIGASPERLVKLSGDELLSTCLAGTSPKGETKNDDATVREILINDVKNLEEHKYVVKMIKNSIDAFCVNIDIPENPIVLSLKNLHHLYTPVKATLKSSYNVFDLVKQLHPTPALGGVPTEGSLAFIRDNEVLDRGWYGAPIGWLDNNKNSEFVVAIRSGLIQADEASLFAGCGIMKDSELDLEYEETNVKFLPMLTAMEEE